jgi:hypothetical protein
MKLDNRRTGLVVALSVFLTEVQGVVQVSFTDEITYGTVQVGVGSPATDYTLLLDTAIANTWVGAKKAYSPTSTSNKTGNAVEFIDTHGSFAGNEYSDTLNLGGNTFQQSIGVAISVLGYNDEGVDGVLGLGPVDLSVGTLSPDTKTEIPTIADNLLSSGKVDSSTVTIGNGLVTFGSPLVDISDVKYAPITKTIPAAGYWGIDASFTYKGTSLVATTAGIIDHGTSLIHLDSQSYQDFLQLIDAVEDSATGLPRVNSCTGLSPIVLTFSGKTLSIPVAAYSFPASSNALIGGSAGYCYLGVGDLGTSYGNGLDFIIGYNTLKHLNVIYDKENSRVGFGNFAIDV